MPRRSSPLIASTSASAPAWAGATIALVAAIVLVAGAAPALGATSCSAQSPASITPVVELYTSEGCSSCPPADRWLSRLKAEPDVVALAFHVDYWDRLGWKDRFASAVYTQRQAQQQASSGARFSYTPQVIVDGIDRPDWPRVVMPPTPSQHRAATVSIQLQRDDAQHLVATITPLSGAPSRLAAYWAVTEQDHASSVKAGENEGATLRHDAVVREYRPVSAWATGSTPTLLRFDAPGAGDNAHPRRINLVVVDAASGRPVQAIAAGC